MSGANTYSGGTTIGGGSVMVVTTALQSFLGTRLLYLPLEDIRSTAFIAAVGWITLQLWRQEPERQPISSDLQEYILRFTSESSTIFADSTQDIS